MLPTLRPGDRLWIQYGRPVAPGDVVVARFPDGTVAVKRAVERRGDGWWLLSDNPSEGIDSRHRGVVASDAVLAVVRSRVWPTYARLRPRRHPRS